MDILKHSVYLLLLTLCVAACRGCDDVDCNDPGDIACPNYDPCWGKERVSAAFEMGERMLHPDSIWYALVSDTCLQGGLVRFRALQEADSVKWMVGSDPTAFRNREFQLIFDFPTSLEVTLVLWRRPDTLCHPDDPGVDTVRRRLVVVPLEEAAIFGRYYGSTDIAPKDSFEMRFYWYPGPGLIGPRFTGIHPGCNNTFPHFNVIKGTIGFNAIGFYMGPFETTTGCSGPQGIAVLDKDDRNLISVTYTMRDPSNTSVRLPSRTFRGRRR